MTLPREVPYPVASYQPRNAIADASGQDQGQDAEGIKVSPVSEQQVQAIVALKHAQLLKSLDDRAYDFSHPVDEYGPNGSSGLVITNTVNVAAEYDMPCRYEAITYVLPVGATSALLQLGQRSMTLYSGAALASPLVQCLPVHGIILNSDDERTLILGGVLTTQAYLGLTGFALTRGQFS